MALQPRMKASYELFKTQVSTSLQEIEWEIARWRESTRPSFIARTPPPPPPTHYFRV